MARIRSLKPELADDAKLAGVSIEARYTFVLLISKADDDGLIPGAHRQLLGLLYPHNEDVTVARLLEWLEELVAIGVVRWRVTRDRVPVVELVNWSKHQRIDNKGRNTLRGMLLDAADAAAPDGDSPNLAESRGESPRLAESRRLEGDRDREKEVDREKEKEKEGEDRRRVKASPRRVSAPRGPTPWVLEIRDRWISKVGEIAASSVARQLSTAHQLYGDEKLLAAIDTYADVKLTAGKDRKLEWFAADVGQWVKRAEAANEPLVDADGILTARGLAVAGAPL